MQTHRFALRLVHAPMAVMILAATILPSAASAKNKQAEAPVPAQTRSYTAEESARIGAEVQRRDEARQRLWDRKMKALTGSICTGC